MNKLYIVILFIALMGILNMPFVHVAPNRILMGEPALLQEVLPLWQMVGFVCLWLCYLPKIFSFDNIYYRFFAVIIAIIISIILMFIPGLYASHLLVDAPYMRVSLGSGFWILWFCVFLLFSDMIRQYHYAFMLTSMLIIIFAVILWQGYWGGLSIAKEYANAKDMFFREALQHIRLVFFSLWLAMMIALPLALLAGRSEKIKPIIFTILNFTQTIPSMALFILLVPPLAWLAQKFPETSASIGFGGIGWAPALIALSLYGILPIFQNAYQAMDAVDDVLKEAALGMGMTKRQQFFQLILPLALPLLLTGIRSTMVLLIGLTAVAGLIGAGGFGRFIFTGLGEQAMDLILLGVIPTVFLALIADMLMGGIIKLCVYR